jgi:hypothetical protein
MEKIMYFAGEDTVYSFVPGFGRGEKSGSTTAGRRHGSTKETWIVSFKQQSSYGKMVHVQL